MKMNIRQIINMHFNELSSLVKHSDIPIYCGNMSEDVLQNCFLVALNKFKDNEIEEEYGFNYLRNTICSEIKYAYRRKGRDNLIFVENLIAYDKMEEEIK